MDLSCITISYSLAVQTYNGIFINGCCRHTVAADSAARDTVRVAPLRGSYAQMRERQKQGIRSTLGGGVRLSAAFGLHGVLEREEGRRAAEPAYFYHTDHLGSTTLLTDSTGYVVQALSYLPYGEEWTEYNEMQRPDSLSLGQYRFNGKERDHETGFLYYGQRYYGIPYLPTWLSVDPMMDKYPSISPYAYCAWNPVKFVDPDGQWPRNGVNIYSIEVKAGIGVGYGAEASWKYGIATDQKGMTHFSAVSKMYVSNQNLNDGSTSPALEIGIDIGGSIGYERNLKYNTFYDAQQSSSAEISIGGKGIVGASIGVGEDSFSGSIGIGVSLSVSMEQYSVVESVSLSKKESKQIGYMGIWSVNNINKHTDSKGNTYYVGNVNDSDVTVRCNARKVNGVMKPDRHWVSDEYTK